MEENIRMSFTYILNWLQEEYYKEMFIESGKWIRYLNFWSPRWHYLERDLTFSNSTFCPHSVFVCFVWIWEQAAIISLYNINWLVFITETECVYCAVRTGSLYTASLTFSNSTFYPHSVFMYFMWISEQTAIISLYSINWLVPITETGCVYFAVRTGSLYTASLTFSNSTFCPHSVFMCFVWIW